MQRASLQTVHYHAGLWPGRDDDAQLSAAAAGAQPAVGRSGRLDAQGPAAGGRRAARVRRQGIHRLSARVLPAADQPD